MSTNQSHTTFTRLPPYMGREAYLVGSARLPGMPPVMTSGKEIVDEDAPAPWSPPAEEKGQE
jgi:hypothetical protein